MHPRWPTRPIGHMPESPRIAIAFALDIRDLVTGNPLSQENFDFAVLAEYGDFEIKIYWRDEKPATTWGDASLDAWPSKFWITYDPRPHDDQGRRYEGDLHTTICRGRFLIGHEIAHSFFYQRKNLPRGEIPQEVGIFSYSYCDPCSDMEHFCDVFAAALLLPPPLLRDRRFSSLSNEELSRKFLVPPGVVKWMRLGFDKAYFQSHWLRLDEDLPLR
jgi:hypothetical protein